MLAGLNPKCVASQPYSLKRRLSSRSAAQRLSVSPDILHQVDKEINVPWRTLFPELNDIVHLDIMKDLMFVDYTKFYSHVRQLPNAASLYGRDALSLSRLRTSNQD